MLRACSTSVSTLSVDTSCGPQSSILDASLCKWPEIVGEGSGDGELVESGEWRSMEWRVESGPTTQHL